MPITGQYIARRLRRSVLVNLSTYVTTVQNELLPVFSNLNNKATLISSDEFDRLQLLPATDEFDVDMSALAEVANEKGDVYFNAMDGLRKTSLMLYTIGLFHLFEQQFANLCRDAGFGVAPPKETKLDVVMKWIKKHLGIDCETLHSWKSIEQLRLLANTAKHGEGDSAKQLRLRRPDLFKDAQLQGLFPDLYDIYSPSATHMPLAGQGLFISDVDFSDFCTSVEDFVTEIAKYFEANANKHFFEEV